MKKDRRWLKSAIAASAEPQIAMPWQRDARRRPASMKADILLAQALAQRSVPTAKLASMAAR